MHAMTTGSPLLDCLVAITERAAAVVSEIYLEGFDVELKGPNDPVTTADRRANQLICDSLRDSFPGCPVVAEESDPSVFGDYRHAPRVFFVDPVDGTREFVRRTGEFVVMIGCVDDGIASAGIIWAPTTNTVWVGQRGHGALRRINDSDFVAIGPTETRVLSTAHMLVSRAQGTEESRALQSRLRTQTVAAMGSAGLKGAAVADGTADAYVALRYAGKRWDACAPDAIVSAAGAVFTDSQGMPIDYRSDDLANRRGLVAANAVLHRELLQRLREEPSESL
jgi:3'(2'), 5'-bisphosphate nucleotidase